MALVKNRNTHSNLQAARVVDIVLNTDSLLAQKIGGTQGHSAIGTIACELIGSEGQQGNAPIYAKPLNDHVKYYPLKNEVVLLIKTVSKNVYKNKNNDHWYYMCNVNIWGNTNHNSLPKGANIFEIQESAPKAYLDSLINSDTAPWEDSDDLDINHGYYFKEKNTIKPLLPYEGDYILEGRFGNSIRLGSTVNNDLLKPSEKNMWSYRGVRNGEEDEDSIGSPITIISNGLPKDPELYKNSPWWNYKEETDAIDKPWVHTTEDINNDPSSIYLTSNQRILGFTPAGVGHRSILADSLEESTTTEALTSATSYIQHPKLSNDLLPETNEEDVFLKSPITPDIEFEKSQKSPLTKMSQEYLSLMGESESENSNPIDGYFFEETPYYMIEGTTDNNTNLNYQSNAQSLINENTSTYLPGADTEGNFGPALDLHQMVGSYFKLIHLISTPKSTELIYDNTSMTHPGAIFVRDTLGFYVEINDNGRKKIITKDFIGNKNTQYHPTSSYNIISDQPQIDPINQNLLEESAFEYSKTDTELIREAESNLFGTYSSYGINNYPGIDPSIDPARIILNLEKVCINVIDPLIEAGYAVNIVSAYRSKALNKILEKNPSNSEHIYGYAIDIKDNSGGNNQGLFNYISNNLEFTNLMWAYPEREENSWIHVSYIEGKLHKKTTLASEKDQYHNIYKGIRRGRNKHYQDNIKTARNP